MSKVTILAELITSGTRKQVSCHLPVHEFNASFRVVMTDASVNKVAPRFGEVVEVFPILQPRHYAEKPSRYWIKVKNSRYSQLEGREELFERI